MPGDIEGIIEEQKQKALVNKLSVQPYIIIEGFTLTDIEKVYVVIDKIRYQFQSVQKAFDIYFKAFHVLDASYPPQAEHLLQFIQQGIYEIFCTADKVFPTQKNC